jgi:hypothetical protein
MTMTWSHRAPALTAALALFLLLGSLSASGQTVEPDPQLLPEPGPVPNSVQQAYHAARAPEAAQIATEDYFFTGDSADQVNKLLASPTATFSQEPPAGSTVTQTSSSLAQSNAPGHRLAASWTGSYSGTIDGELQLRWWWSSANAVSHLLTMPVEVTVFADVQPNGTGQASQIIGQHQVQVSVGATPTLNEGTVPVKGDVDQTLTIQARPVYSDAGHALDVSYGSTSTPSGFGIPTGPAPDNLPQSTPVAYDGEPLSLQQSYVGRYSAEPTVGVTTDGTAFWAAGAFDAPAKGSPLGGLARTEVLRSDDGGLTWDSVQPELLGPVTGPPTTLDPYVYVDPDTDRVFNPELYLGCTYMNYSDDHGETWSVNPVACGDFVNDHQSVFAGPPPPGLETDGYPNVLYYCFNRIIDANCGRSLDGGVTFLPTVGEPAFVGFDPNGGGLCGGLHGHVHTDSEGRLFMPKGHCGWPWLGISEDGGETWERVQVSDQIDSGSHTHLAVATDDADNVYFVWWDGQRRLPWMSVSTDHGRTWGEPLMIAPPGVKESNFPVIDAGAPGHITITFPGGTQERTGVAAEDNRRPWNTYVVVSTNATDGDPLFLSATGNDPADPIHRGNCEGRCGGMYDFMEIKVSPAGEVWATSTDTCMDLTNKCVTGNDPPRDGQGVALRQIGGPNLLAPDDTAGSDEPDDPASEVPGSHGKGRGKGRGPR